jgi:hypothetical protein
MTHPDEGSETGSELMPFGISREAWRRVLEEPTPEPRFDPVERPAHYAAGAIECADAIAVAIADEPDALVAWCRGNAIKYLWRAGKKGHAAEDLRKAIWYIDRAATHLEARDGDRQSDHR